jgi:hypothetical protein
LGVITQNLRPKKWEWAITAEVSCAALDRVDDLVSDALVNIAPVGLHG